MIHTKNLSHRPITGRAVPGSATVAMAAILLLTGSVRATGLTPPTAAIDVEITETAMNRIIDSLVEVRGINFGEYEAGFIDAWWINLDDASIDVRSPVGSTNRVRINSAATAKTVIDLFVVNVPITAYTGSWIEGDVTLTGDPASGYKMVIDVTDIDLSGWISGVPGWLETIIFWIVENNLERIPPLELNLGTGLAPSMTCVTPELVTNSARTALVLRWDVADLGCLPAHGAPSSECVGVDYLRVDLGLPAATCEAYCASIGQTCSNSCTTNRGYPNWGVEAWSTESQCGSYATSGGQVKCNTNLANYSYHNRRKYRCCCG